MEKMADKTILFVELLKENSLNRDDALKANCSVCLWGSFQPTMKRFGICWIILLNNEIRRI